MSINNSIIIQPEHERERALRYNDNIFQHSPHAWLDFESRQMKNK